MLPIFIESSNNPAMVWHGLKVIRQAINYINPGQTPVMEVDQPLFTLAKKLQWKNQGTEFDEESFLVTLGAMHTEKMLWGVSGDWLDGSGWVTALTNSGIASSGKAQSFIGVHHICRTRYMHQVSVAAIYTLVKRAYDRHISKANEENTHVLTFSNWLMQLQEEQPQADFWFKSMELDLLILHFVKSCRTADFKLYIETLHSLMPWIFALDHTNYARNLPVHLRDMVTLEERHPALFVEFKRGHFMGQKSKRAFSNIPRDQMHEQLIDWLKNHAGVIENLDDPSTIRREQVVRPEMARLVREFEGTQKADEKMHHEQYPKFQTDFKADVASLVDAFEQLGNPFLEDSGQMLDLDQSIIMPPEVVDNMRDAENIGKQLYDSFLHKRILTQEEAFTDPLPKRNLKLFKAHLAEPRRKSDISAIKDQHSKATQLLLAANSGRTLSDSVFAHESSDLPPSLTAKGKMYHGEKSEILECITPNELPIQRPVTTAAVLDGAVIVQMIRPRNSVTFGEYFTEQFVPYIMTWFESNERVDIVWDVYSKTSLKAGTREQRGTGVRRRVTFATKIPGNWAAFLRVDLNKEELFVEIANNLALLQLPDGKQLFTTILDKCTSSPPEADITTVSPCTQEEADSRIFLHVAAAASCGHRHVIVRTTDSDVVVLAVSAYVSLGEKIDELWVAFGMQRRYRYIPVHNIVAELGQAKSAALPAFHALTGCDTTSSFFGKGKKTAWTVWQSLPELTVPLQLLSGPHPSEEILTTYTEVLQKFVLHLYGVSQIDISTVNAGRRHLFLKKGKDFLHMPPGSDAFHQHLLRVAYQSGHVWGNMLNKDAGPLPVTDWGWQSESPDVAPTPVYRTIQILSKKMPELASCQCKTPCKPPCSCCMHGQPCMLLCTCKCL